jgi:hypothetical protein
LSAWTDDTSESPTLRHRSTSLDITGIAAMALTRHRNATAAPPAAPTPLLQRRRHERHH